jgi:hypothetical protein
MLKGCIGILLAHRKGEEYSQGDPRSDRSTYRGNVEAVAKDVGADDLAYPLCVPCSLVIVSQAAVLTYV